MAIRILHTGDLHIGNFPGPEKNGENARYLDICKCLDALVEGAREQKPGIAVIAGDIFHQARVWSDRGLKEQQTAVKFLRELSAICPVVVMRGTPNHDSEQQFEMLKTAFEGNGEVKIITEPQVVEVFSGAYGWVQVACLPGFDRGYYRAQHPGLSKEEENEVFTKAIADMIIGLKAQCKAGTPAVLVSHYTITGCNMESGQTAFFSQFEPVVYPDTLAAADFDLVCFGHIHRPQQLEGCKNTFYCGAISQLNFNDEGQERGYWIHDIGGSGEVKSTFQQLPTRQHKTLRLNDEDVAGITTGELEVADFLDRADDLNGKIVRVLYDCTDEHNKAFNHAVFENMLYAAGAFWVQEITPQKITITVDRRSMDADGTPESNLADYLAEKEFTPERIGELVELARPLIAEATEKATQERHTGLFVPVEIEVKNYRNYREEKFSFDGIRFCTINGSNGVGKSSLFMDAMLDALYEEPREGELTGWICNDPEARSGAIKFTFKLGDRLYRVTRTRQKSGKATLNIAEYVEGEWVDRSKEKFKDTQQEIINIIGMDSLTLKACALIMQDQYGLFLQADKEARMNILGSILGLGIYGDMEEMAANRATDTNRTIRSLADRADTLTAGLPDSEELAAEIEAAEARRKGMLEQAESKTAEVDTLKVKLNTQLEAAARVMKLNSKITTLTAQQASKEAAKTAQVATITAAETILAAEPEITAGVAHYKTLLEREKELIKGKAAYDSLATRKQQIESAITLAESAAKDNRQKKAALTLMKIGPLAQAIERAAELTEKHQQYEAATAQLAELEKLLPEFTAARDNLTTWQAEAERTERDYREAKTRLEGRIASLKGKVELLKDSGCPAPDNATCKFLADALAARDALPGEEAALASLEEEYGKLRQTNADALSAAKQAFDDKKHVPEEIDALRASLRLLEAAERDYNNLEAQRSELAVLEERAAELEKSVADAEATAAKGRAELAEVEQRLEQAAAYSRDYDELQQTLLAESRWLDKEKQLPVAREQKAAAAQRILELGSELTEIGEEIREARAELADEQSKTVGREELQAQVDTAEAEVKAVQKQAQELSLRIGGLQAKLGQIRLSRKQAAELQEQMNELGGKAAGYEELKKAFSQDGIPHNIIRSIIPVFEATATNILGQMSQGRMSVEFVTEKVLKSNSKKEVTTLDIIINDSDTGRLPYMSRSGGERVKAALSVILALSEIKSSKAGVQLGFLFIDEPPFLDAPGVQAYCDALEAIQQRYGDLKVMAITHDPAMKSRFPQSVDVVKTPEGSKVIYE
ncbi:exonuclease subunit SbcD [Flavonifractor plautii]|uniref:exonuclease subunit SbcD n=1 Tax=Flavonifractor plautii TaxID=292800 RepID=UPI001D09889B|nr:exonuclease subunit SbcD [Flavonifractor plautii]MCB7042625.1 exonuclease subunit SbcD [Flavonifractor plautii]